MTISRSSARPGPRQVARRRPDLPHQRDANGAAVRAGLLIGQLPGGAQRPRLKADSKHRQNPERGPRLKPTPKPKPERRPNRRPEPKPKPERRPNRKPEPKPKPERRPNRKPEPKPKPERRSNWKPAH